MKSNKYLFGAIILITCFSKIAVSQCIVSLSAPNDTVCAGADIQFNTNPSAGCNPVDSIQWYNGGSFITTSVTTTTTIVAPMTAGSYNFSVLLFYNASADTAFDTLSIVVSPLTPANIISSAQSICSGSAPLILTGPIITGGTGTVQYEWEESSTGPSTSFTAAPGTNNNHDYGPPNLTTDRWYRRVVTAGLCSDTSVSIKITVFPVLSTNTVSAAQTICANQIPAPLTGTNVSGGNGTTTYLWQLSTTGAGTGFTAAPGSNTNQNYSPLTLSTDTWFRRAATAGPCNDTSASIKITVNPGLTPNTVGIAQSICYADTPNTLLGTLVTGGTGSISYLWQESTIGPSSGFGSANGANTSQNYNPPPLTADRWYRRVVISGACNDTSSAIKITVKATPSVVPLNIVNPICSGGITNISLSAAPNNVPGTMYKWIVTSTNLTGASAQPTPVAGPIQQTVTLINSINSGSVTYIVTPEANGCEGPQATVTTTVNPAAGIQPVISSTIVNDTVCSNTHGVNFMVSNQQSGINYVWSVTPVTVTIIGDSLANCILNIPPGISGNVTVTTIASNQFNCSITGTTTFIVDTSEAPDTTIIYLYSGAKTLICMNNSFESYQWGYDSLNLTPVSLPGEIYQDLILNSLADTLDKYFWVITSQGNCYTKSYYNSPTGSGRTIEIMNENEIKFNIINQNTDGFDLLISGNYTGSIRLYLHDIRGSLVLDKIISKELIVDQISVPYINNAVGIYFISMVAKDAVPVTGKFFITSK